MAKPKPRNYIQIQLTCSDQAEAATIAGALLGQRLIVCAKRLPIEAASWWQGEIEQGAEILLLMDSAADLFDAIEAEVTKLHSYDTFVLQAFPIDRISTGAQAWMTENLAPSIKSKKK